MYKLDTVSQKPSVKVGHLEVIIKTLFFLQWSIFSESKSSHFCNLLMIFIYWTTQSYYMQKKIFLKDDTDGLLTREIVWNPRKTRSWSNLKKISDLAYYRAGPVVSISLVKYVYESNKNIDRHFMPSTQDTG